MATTKEISDDVNNYWIGWDQRGPEYREYDVSDGEMRAKCREFEKRKAEVDARVLEFEKLRNKYKKRD
ncbi:hypothetical protein NVP1081O_141 [Vibrio phage 1.081.O._10N.286.52.C2]|nr:hypothetical protein NVP1081O_141 [Vibrio phage 1.081.O._10N.286.52.C2]